MAVPKRADGHSDKTLKIKNMGIVTCSFVPGKKSGAIVQG